MIVFVNGILEMKQNGYVVINVGGIGYKVYMSDTSIEKLGNIADVVKVYTHHHVREDDVSLYGFLTMEELNMFELLISVSGVGAKSALNMLANIEPYDFALAVVSNDTSKLVRIQGIGTKTAARIILELKDKIKNENMISCTKQNLAEKINADINNNLDEAISALQVLGYNRKDIEKALEKVDIKDLKLEDIIKHGLKMLAK